jgi:DNA-binding PadR family transcriptional regulator
MSTYLGEFEQLVLLGLLRLGEQAYGVTIRQEIERRTGRDVSIGSVYTTLDRLERKGYLRSWKGVPTPERGGRRKKHYALEPAGEQALSGSWESVRRMAAGIEGRLGEMTSEPGRSES